MVLARLADGKWSGPSGILIHTVGFGLLVGADIYDVVLILRTESALESFTNPKFNLGAQLAIAAGPVGMLSTKTSYQHQADLLQAMGLYWTQAISRLLAGRTQNQKAYTPACNWMVPSY